MDFSACLFIHVACEALAISQIGWLAYEALALVFLFVYVFMVEFNFHYFVFLV